MQLGDDEERGGKEGGQEDGQARKAKCLLGGYLSLYWVENELVSVQGNQDDGEGGEEDAAGLDGPIQLAQNLLKVENKNL